MDGAQPHLSAATFAWRLGATFFFVALNAFFVAAEFALVKVRTTRLRTLAERGSRPARAAQHIVEHLDRYLSACQLGVTLASLILGWLAEPAIADLLIAGVTTAGGNLSPTDPLLHGVALAIALTIITALHMTIGEQAPKIWAINRPDVTALAIAYPLQAFATVFRPFIWAVNEMSNALLRVAGIAPERLQEISHNLEEIRGILTASAQAGHISGRQLELAENVFGIIGLEVRHILLPRVDVTTLSLRNSLEENLQIIRRSGHSRLPLCKEDLDSVVGIVHAKDVMTSLIDDRKLDLEQLAHNPVFVSDTQPLSRFIGRMQQTRSHCAVVVDEHGTAVGLAFLEDAIEEIVGPIQDEFDAQDPSPVSHLSNGVLEVPGALALPEAIELLALPEPTEETDTIGGYVVARLGRLPARGDTLEIGRYRVTVTDVARRRVTRLRMEPIHADDGEAEEVADPGRAGERALEK
jgi:magnesium and cobalt exporter, CNNM family